MSISNIFIPKSQSSRLTLACHFIFIIITFIEIESFHHVFTSSSSTTTTTTTTIAITRRNKQPATFSTTLRKLSIFPPVKKSYSSAHYMSSTKKGFGTPSSSSLPSSVGLSNEDKKRKGTIDSLEQWSRKVKIVTKDVKVEAGPKIIGGGLGLITTASIPKSNSLLFQVPTDLTFSVSTSDLEVNLSSEQYFINKAKTYRSAPWYAKLAIDLFICDKISSLRQSPNKNNDSDGIDMRPWLDSLPREFSTPIHWTQRQREELQYKPLQSMISAQEKSYKQLYQNLKKDIVQGSKLDEVQWSYDDFLWGCDVAKSRAFSGAYGGTAFDPKPYALTLTLVVAYVGLGLGSVEQASNGAALVFCGSIIKDFVAPKLFKNKKYVICPMIDMANHVGTGEEGNVAFEYFGNGYSLSTTKAMQQGKEVKISYGPRSNDVLLQQYGFVEVDNVHDVYVMPPLREWDIQALEEACGRNFQPGRLEKLDRAGLLGGTSLSVDDNNEYDEGSSNRGRGVVISRAGGIDPAIMTALRALVSTESEWNLNGEAVGNFVTENSGGNENERVARLAAQKALELELDSMETTLDSDQELLTKMSNDSTSFSHAEILAVQFRIEKKKLLKETIFSFSLLK